MKKKDYLKNVNKQVYCLSKKEQIKIELINPFDFYITTESEPFPVVLSGWNAWNPIYKKCSPWNMVLKKQ